MKINKNLIKILAFMFIITSIGSIKVFANELNDIENATEYAKSSILELANNNIIYGDNNGNFNPQKVITREEMVTMIVRVLGIDIENAPENPTFADMPKNHWAYKYVEAANRVGITKGIGSGKFGTKKLSTREEMTSMFIRSLKLVDSDNKIEINNVNKFVDNEEISNWAKKDVELAVSTGLMTGMTKDKFGPKDSAKREQVAVVIDRYIKNKSNVVDALKNEFGLEEDITIAFNGDIISLENRPYTEDKNILVPIDEMNESVLGYEAPSYIEEEDIIYIEFPGDNDVYDVIMKPGVNKAYVNAEIDAFTNEEAYLDNSMDLRIAPIVKEGVVYVSLEDFSDIFGIEYKNDYNNVTMKSEVIDKYPLLYNVMSNNYYNPYKGIMEMNGSLVMTDLNTNEYVDTKQNIFSKINEYNGYSKSEYNVEFNGTTVNKTYEEVVLNENYFIKGDQDKWTQYDRNEAVGNVEGGYLINALPDSIDYYQLVVSIDFFDNYSEMPIEKVGAVEVDGKEATKYTVELDSEEVKNIFGNLDGQFSNVDINSQIDYTMEFYVYNDEIIKEVFVVNSTPSELSSDNNIEVIYEIEINFKNIGENFEITAPEL